jgi:DnaA family protein
MMHRQLQLSLNLRDDAIFDNFHIDENDQIVRALISFLTTRAEQFIYCYGESGSGRTHLLQACCHLAREQGKTAFYLSLSQHTDFSADILRELEQYEVVCIDDVDAIVGDSAWEEALFHFYNRARDNGTVLLVSAQSVPRQLNCLLPDLQSRLSWGVVLEIKNLPDSGKIQALQMRADLRGFHLSDEVAQYLVYHYSRNMRDLFEMLKKLDHASLAAKRKITIPFLKSII